VKNKKELKENARNYSIQEGIFASIKNSLGDRFFHPFAVAINSSNSVIAMITAITGLFGPISQLFGSKLIEKYSRKKIICKGIIYESLFWIPLILIAILFQKGISINLLPLALLISISFLIISSNIIHPAWFSWIGDIVDKKHRGRWFAKRNLINNFIIASMAIIASFFLDYFKKQNWTMYGFIILFFLALLSRLITKKITKKIYEPKIKKKNKKENSFMDFIINSPKTNLGRLAIFRLLFTFSFTISASLLAVYLLKYLEFSYTEYIIILLLGPLMSVFSLKFWGIFSDNYGNYKLLLAVTLSLPVIQASWIFYESFFYLLVVSTASGIAWAGIHLAENNFIYDNIKKENRGQAISYYNIYWGIGTSAGAILGAILIKFLNTSFIVPIKLIFIISAISGLICILIYKSKLKEIRKVKKIEKKFLEKIFIYDGMKTINKEIHYIKSIPHYIELK
jgi:MFS family permease